jgi:tol-pal system protein YbgF
VAARPVGSDQQNYDAAFALLQARKYDEAAPAFEAFLSQFPTSPRADNAVYWLAETHYVRGRYNDALPVFRRVIEQYPQSDKVPDALLKVGYCQDELGDRAAARQSLQEVMRQFPDTTAARLASQRLDRLPR